MGRRIRIKRGLFKPPKHKWLADIVSFKSITAARKSAQRLLKALKRKRIAGRKIGRKTALVIVRALYYAANRAKAAAKRKGLSARERKQLLGVSKVYRKAGEKASKIYKKLYKR